ncbi:hypothetical protein SAMN05443429_1233 [Cruoricaptor ignavus]|uniref:Uncharacterized protein n=1 Tax=Cruoricaptor ignavus TaxID=1118202 RepID=A0A1M6HX29_9FLAO|nr:hypothetical protein [Cruoricaptor ignavus]SHJ26782.1 hypothetical protein SAMN05443429_1233 [Cruoricaptor ignavus]
MQAAAHGISQGALSLMQGVSFKQAFIAGALGSLGASAWGYALNKVGLSQFASSAVGTVAFGALSGGIGAELSGGNFWQGAAIGAVVTVFNHFNHEEPPTDFNEDYYYDPETGYSYFKTSEYLYEVRDQSGKLIQEKYISQVAIKYKFADVRQQMEGYKILGNVLTGIGFAMTITGVGAPAGVVLMTLGGGINTVVAAINTTTYLAEKRYSKAGWEAGGEAASAITGGVAGKLIKPSKDLFRGYNSELGEQVISTFTGEVATPIIEQQVKTVY